MAGIYSTDDVRNASSTWIRVPTPIPIATLIRDAILNALAFFDGNQDRAGGALGLSDRMMNHHMRRAGIPTSRLRQPCRKSR